MATPVNENSGVAARNGTNSHTISFGFTSTTGNFLVFVVAGAVTHAATGWTEQHDPVGDAELSIFTKTSAGDTSITVTHNASDYPVSWYAWEWIAGTTWVNGAEESANDTTFPALGSLPGDPVELGAALAIAVGAEGGPTPTASWTAGSEGWAEEFDSFTADNGTTDGIYLTVATASEFTGTTTTPAGTFSPLDNPPIIAANRQKIVWALEVPAEDNVEDLYGHASETDTSMPFTAATQIVDTFDFAAETDTAMPFAAASQILDEYGHASETDLAMPFEATIQVQDEYGFASETDLAMPFTAASDALDTFGVALETDTAMPFATTLNVLDTFGVAGETNTAMPFEATILILDEYDGPVETDLAMLFEAATQITDPIDFASEIDTAMPFTATVPQDVLDGYGFASETDLAMPFRASAFGEWNCRHRMSFTRANACRCCDCED